jgi:hypothetical protein
MYSIKLTDAPAATYTAVNVDIQGVEVTSNQGAVTLSVNPGIYNLLNFANGASTLIATGALTPGRVQQIRLILGNNNSVSDSAGTHALEIPSSSESGLKLQVHDDVEAGVAYEVLLDFDAGQSVVREGNGQYKLKPVIRTVVNALSGAIRGRVLPAGVQAMVTATNSAGAYSSPVDVNGDYLIQGVPAGTYSVQIVPATPYFPANVNNVQVTTGVTTSVAAVQL